MQRILIADEAECFASGLVKQLKNDFTVLCCHKGKDILTVIREFEPDIIFMDLSLAGCDPLLVLHTVSTAGCGAQLVVRAANTSVQVQQILAGIGVVRIFPKPCSLEGVVSFLHRLASGLPDLSQWCAETEIDATLLHLGFQCGRSRYHCIHQAILLKYCGKGGDSAKFLYSEVRKLCGKKSIEVVEKAIRDAVGHAWKHGDRAVWKMYFPACDKCPSNEVFIARIAMALLNREKLKKVYVPEVNLG